MGRGKGYGWGLEDVDNRGDMNGLVDMNGAEGGGIWMRGLEDMDWVVDMNGAGGGVCG